VQRRNVPTGDRSPPVGLYRTKVPYAAVGSTVKSVFDHVIRRLNALSVGLKRVERLNVRWDTA
jgi:hypothetical protein